MFRKHYANVPCKESRAVFIAPEFPEMGAHTAGGQPPPDRGGRVSAAPSSLLGQGGQHTCSNPASSAFNLFGNFFEGGWDF